MRNLIALATVVALPSLALAQDAAGGGDAPAARQADPTAKGRFGVDFTSQYFFRGIRQESKGLILQPWADIQWGLIDGNDNLRSLDLTIGTWNSLHGSGVGDGMWYEGRGYVDLAAGVAEKWTLGARYTGYGNPNDAGGWDNVQEVAFRAALDDRGYLADVVESGLQPHALVAIETAGERETFLPGAPNRSSGVYAEFGVAPSFKLGVGDDDLRLHLPVVLGLSLDDYYQDNRTGKDELFGYLDVGVEARQPLTFLPGRMGPWNAVVGLHFLLLGDNCEERNTSTGGPGDEIEFVLNVGVSTRF